MAHLALSDGWLHRIWYARFGEEVLRMHTALHSSSGGAGGLLATVASH